MITDEFDFFLSFYATDWIPLTCAIVKPDAVGAGSVDAILDAIRGAEIEILARKKQTLTPKDIAHLHGGGGGRCCGGGGDLFTSGSVLFFSVKPFKG